SKAAGAGEAGGEAANGRNESASLTLPPPPLPGMPSDPNHPPCGGGNDSGISGGDRSKDTRNGGRGGGGESLSQSFLTGGNMPCEAEAPGDPTLGAVVMGSTTAMGEWKLGAERHKRHAGFSQERGEEERGKEKEENQGRSGDRETLSNAPTQPQDPTNNRSSIMTTAPSGEEASSGSVEQQLQQQPTRRPGPPSSPRSAPQASPRATRRKHSQALAPAHGSGGSSGAGYGGSIFNRTGAEYSQGDRAPGHGYRSTSTRFWLESCAPQQDRAAGDDREGSRNH
ncbi:unnamed protein product, partial [Discosporangium mesarthrocarpum]